MNKVVANDVFFEQKRDAAGRLGMSSIQKCIAAIRVLAYRTGADLHDDYLRMSAQTIRKSVKKFVEGIISNFGEECLRKPNEADIAYLLQVGEERGFPGILGSIDCMHWEWKNYPSAWAGQYAGRNGNPIIILEAVARLKTYGSDMPYLELHVQEMISTYLNNLLFLMKYWKGEHQRLIIWLMAKSIILDIISLMAYILNGATFVKSINAPQIWKHQLFAQHQEAARKDVERAFGVLQGRFAFLKRSCLIWDRDIMGKIMIDCIIMHTMIVEDERHSYLNYRDRTEFMDARPTPNSTQSGDGEENDPNFEFSTERIASLSNYIKNRSQLRNIEVHAALQNDLIEHIWQKFGDGN